MGIYSDVYHDIKDSQKYLSEEHKEISKNIERLDKYLTKIYCNQEVEKARQEEASKYYISGTEFIEMVSRMLLTVDNLSDQINVISDKVGLVDTVYDNLIKLKEDNFILENKIQLLEKNNKMLKDKISSLEHEKDINQ